MNVGSTETRRLLTRVIVGGVLSLPVLIIAMSHGLAIRVVAEGVETDDQLRFLMRRKCDEAQGNYLARPVAAAAFAEAVRGCSGIGVLQNV